jgi:NAD(P)H-hydrate epimerase
LGTGLDREISGDLINIIDWVNKSESTVVAIDVPTGLRLDQISSGKVIEADLTITFNQPKIALTFPENHKFVGDFIIARSNGVSEFFDKYDSNTYYVDKSFVESMIPDKMINKFDHKGKNGFGLLVAGSYGSFGAAVLSGRAAYRSGIGKLTIQSDSTGMNVIQISVPEALFQDNKLEDPIERYSAIAIGPGIGINENSLRNLTRLVDDGVKNLVIDADGLNLLSENKKLLTKLPQKSILTPHPKEFSRIADKEFNNNFEEYRSAKKFASSKSIILILKGAHTKIFTPDNKVYINSTGNPGLATAGSGDVLTGIILAYLCRGIDPINSSILAVYNHGLAADKLIEKQSKVSIVASDIITSLKYI